MTFLRLITLVALTGITAETQAAESQKPLKVFILAGQSNMQGHAHVRTLPSLATDAETAPLLEAIMDDQGGFAVCRDVCISYLSAGGEKHGHLTTGFGADAEKIGPELTFGLLTQKRLQEPILIIKVAWGGKSLHTDFRPPSAGPYEFTAQQRQQFKDQGKDLRQIAAEKKAATGHYYRLMIEHVRQVLADPARICPEYNPQQGCELAGFVWFQGWNDMVDRGTYPNRGEPGGYDQYTRVLAHLIRDVRKDLSAPELPVVVGVLGVGGPVDEYGPEQQRYSTIHQNFRDAMAAVAKMPEFRDSVVNVLTENCWDRQLHFLRSRQSRINTQIRETSRAEDLSREEQQALQRNLQAEEFSDEERRILTLGISNQEYHYLGAARIIARIGRDFASALGTLAQNE